MSVGERERVSWVEEFVYIDADQSAEAAVQKIQEAKAKWIVISRQGGNYLYAFTIDELWRWPALRDTREKFVNWLAFSFERVLDLHEEYQSTPSESRDNVPPIDRSWRRTATAPSIARYIQIDHLRMPCAVGYMTATRQTRRAKPSAPVPPPTVEAPPAPPPAAPPDVNDHADVPHADVPHSDTPPRESDVTIEVLTEDEDDETEEDETEDDEMEPATDAKSALEDEGTTPVRYPSIETDKPLVPGAQITATIDLTRTATEHTQGGEMTLGEQAADWTELALNVIVFCPSITFDGEGRGVVTVRRNAASTAAKIAGTVHATAKEGETASIVATFFHGRRFCGSALRTFTISVDVSTPASPPPAGGPPTKGTIVPQPSAVQPDVTVRVFNDQPTTLTWLVETARFDGLPAKLHETVTLGHDVDTEVSDLFKNFAVLEPGAHVTRIEGFGTRLWKRAPRMFRDAYWALWDHYRRPLTIQFITDEPHLPWELMRPAREDESEIHKPLALQHSVARWLDDYDGYMRNQVPPGGVFTIAPKYATVSLQLPRAQAESQKLVKNFGAHPIPGTRVAVLQLLQTLPPEAPVALLHFAGHGQFVRTAAIESSIKLEDGPLTAGEVGRPEVRLGKACRSLVFFNACDVGASGTLFGEVGGWAAAFLERQFGGFIAPLWSVEDDDAGVVADELLTGIVTEHKPIGEVLRALRAKHGEKSPTFYSYLYYGDVTASLAP